MVMRGSPVTLTGTFYEFEGGPPFDPADTALNIYRAGVLIHGPITGDLVHTSPGIYTYEWMVPVDAALGDYLARWSGTLPGNPGPSYGYEEFTVTTAFVDSGADGCLWPLDPACLSEEWDAYSEAVQHRAHSLASATLHRLTGYRAGGCPITVRPCKASCVGQGAVPYAGRWMHPHIGMDGYWINSCGCTHNCSCTELCEVSLPEPVGEVYEVLVDGIEVSSGDYRVDGSTLIWTGDTECPWPVCQDMAAATSEPGTFAVTYLNSWPVDSLGAYAAGILAMEYAKACTGGKCRLPASVTSISRQGVTFEIASGAFPDGFTGIREVDTYISLWNPGALRQRASVWSPDIPTTRVVR